MSILSEIGAAIKSKLDLKSDKLNPVFTGTAVLPANTSIGTVDSTKISYLNTLTSNVQTQLNAKLSTTGNAASATKLQTARTINGVSFDGSANISVNTNNSEIIKFDSGTTEGTDLYTFNGSSAKTIDIKAGTNVTLTKTAGSITISANDTSVAWSEITSKPTTLSGYGITDSIQSPLVSGTSIRTINGSSVLGSGDISTIQTTITGNAGTATKLQTARTINGVSFDGSANISVNTNNSEIIKFDSGTTEGTDLYTFNGSSAKTIDIKAGTNVTLTKTAGSITISANDTSVAWSEITSKPTTLSGYGITDAQQADSTYSKTASLVLSTEWQDTGITSTNLSAGTWIIQISSVSDNTVGGGHYQEYYSGVMSWFDGGTNSTVSDEIQLHRAGHAPNSGVIYLRTIRSVSGGYLKLQISGSATNTSAYGYVFKFRKMI